MTSGVARTARAKRTRAPRSRIGTATVRTPTADSPSLTINVFNASGADALNPAEEALDAKDSAALGTTETISAGITSQFQSVSDFFAAEGVTKSATKVAPYVIQPVSAG